jgi:hypothetical protein
LICEFDDHILRNEECKPGITTIDYVSLPPSAVIAQFRKAVKAEYDQPGYLKDIPSGNLLVFKNKQ